MKGFHKDTKTKYDPEGFDRNDFLKTKKEKDMSIYLLLSLKYILIIVQKN